MRELLVFGAIIAAAAWSCAAILKALFWWRSIQPFEHLSYELEPYPEVDPTAEDYERLWAEVGAALEARGDRG